MEDTLIITADEVIEKCPPANTFEKLEVEMYIPFAQTNHLKNTIGVTMYTELLNATTGDTAFSGLTYVLVERYIKPMLAWYTIWEGAFAFRTQISNKGINMGFSDTAKPLTDTEFYNYKQELLDKATGLKGDMVNYIEDNTATFTTYRSETDGIDEYSSGIYLS